MPPARARKSSTSSGRPRRPRPRYLGVEAAGGEPFPLSSSTAWVPRLRDAFDAAGLAQVPFRVVRTEGPRAIVEVEARHVPAARRAWNPEMQGARGCSLGTTKTWGTLQGAKAWLARARTTA